MNTAMNEDNLSPTARRLLAYAKDYAERRAAELVRELGSGGSASVFLLRRDDGQTALKVYDPRFLDEANGAAEMRRIELQRRLIGSDCPYLVGIVGIVLEDNTCFIEMEYVDWKNLKDAIPDVPPDRVESLFSQLLTAVQYLDDRDLVHRDIKPENIMIDSQFAHLKLIDFGVMRELGTEEDAIDATDHGLRRPFIASAQYSSPEYLFRLKEPSPDSWRALTIYQLGGVLHDMLMRRPLFDDIVKTENKFALAMAVLTRVPALSGVPQSLKGLALLAANSLVKDSELRLALVNIKNMMPVAGGGAERLKAISSQKAANRQAQDSRALAEAQIKHARSTALDALQAHVRAGFIAVVDKNYGLTVHRTGDEQIEFEVAMSKGVSLRVVCHFQWLSSFTPLVANVFLTATLGTSPKDATTLQKALGQAVAGEGLNDQFGEAVLNMVCEVVAATAEHLALGDQGDGPMEFVDAVGLINPN